MLNLTTLVVIMQLTNGSVYTIPKEQSRTFDSYRDCEQFVVAAQIINNHAVPFSYELPKDKEGVVEVVTVKKVAMFCQSSKPLIEKEKTKQ